MRPARRRLCLILPFALSFACENASAHAILTASSPAASATVTGPEVPLTLRFNSRIDQARSKLVLTGPDGKTKTVALGQAAEPDALTARTSGLKSGDYKLRWEVLAIDGHITRGDIPFHVKAP